MSAVAVQDFFHIVLVEPEDSINIGCVARAMLNCGFKHLHLVSPLNYDPEKAAWSACWAAHLLNDTKIYQTLDQALQEMTDVIGFSARESRNRREQFFLTTWSETFKVIPEGSRIALLFGNERTGLRNEHLTRCRALIKIPASKENPSYNLAQGVLLALFEIYRSTLSTERHVVVKGQKPATAEGLKYLDNFIDELLNNSGFYHKSSSPAVKRILSNLIRRMQPDERELGILLSVFNHLARVTSKQE